MDGTLLAAALLSAALHAAWNAAVKAHARPPLAMTAQMLAFSRRQKLEPRAVDLNETVRSMGDMLQSAIGGSVHIEQPQLAADLWPAMIDPTQIELVILNLAINARDAMEVGGSLTIRTENARLDASGRPDELPPGDYVVVSVSDTGSGMTDEVLSHARRLMAIGCFCIGTNQVDLEAAELAGIPVFNAPYSNTRSDRRDSPR